MAPGRVNQYLYVAIVSVLAIMPGMMTLLPPAIRHFMGTKDIGLKFGLVLTGEVRMKLYSIRILFRSFQQPFYEVFNQLRETKGS